MLFFSMLTQPFAMIPDNGHQGLRPGSPEACQETTCLGVHECQFTVIRFAGKQFSPGGRRPVGSMGVEEMDPEKGGALIPLPPPGQGPVNRDVPSPLRPCPHLIVIDVEAPIKAVPPVQNGTADEGAGLITTLGKPLRQDWQICIQAPASVGAQTVTRRIKAAQQRRVRGKSQGGRRVTGRENRPRGRQAIQVGADAAVATVGAQVIRPGCVQGDEYDVRMGVLAGGSLTDAASVAASRGRQDQDRCARHGESWTILCQLPHDHLTMLAKLLLRAGPRAARCGRPKAYIMMGFSRRAARVRP